MGLFVLRKYLAVGETIILIMYSNAVFITETILIGKNIKIIIAEGD